MHTKRFLQVLSVCVRALVAIAAIGVGTANAQGLGGAGTVQGTVKDPTGGVMQAVEVRIQQPGLRLQPDDDDRRARASIVFRNLPPNPYHLAVAAQGFQTLERDVDVRSGVPITLDLALALAGATATVEVVGHAEDLLERDPTAHTDIDQSLIAKLPLESSSGLNQVITLASPGVVADSNGFFHPIGDHAQTQFSIDNQPVTDQQSRVYSNQISPDAVQSMEVITGVAAGRVRRQEQPRRPHRHQVRARPAEADRQRVVRLRIVQEPDGRCQRRRRARTRSANFLSVSGMRTDRFLDPPEFEALHDTGNSLSFFDRLDAQPSDLDTFHLNVQVGAVVVRRAEHARSERRRAGAAPEDHHVQHRAGLFARHRLERAVHRERASSAGTS